MVTLAYRNIGKLSIWKLECEAKESVEEYSLKIILGRIYRLV